MKIILSILAALAIVLAIAGCGKKAEETQAPATEATQPADTSATPAPQPAPGPQTPATVQETKPGQSIKLPSGLIIKDIKIGTGDTVVDHDMVTVHYTGWLDNKKVFDTSKKEGRGPFSFTVGGGDVIKGWDEGLKGMKIGGTRELTVPPALGYGDMEMPTIPANSTLHFKVELLEISKGQH